MSNYEYGPDSGVRTKVSRYAEFLTLLVKSLYRMYMHKIKKLHEVIFFLFLGCYFETSCVW